MFFPIPDFKGFDFFPHNTRLPFMRYKGLCLLLSVVFMAASLGLYFTKGLNYGVDFVGGSLIEVQHKNGPADLGMMREKLNALGIGSVQIQSFGADTDVLIRVEQQKGGEGEQQVAMKKGRRRAGPRIYPAAHRGRRTDRVERAAAHRHHRGAGLVGGRLHLRLVSFRMAVCGRLRALAAARRARDRRRLSLLGLEFDLTIVAALLTILGYSVNDSVVVSDRIRENLRKYKRMDLNELLNISINETLSRTILTGVTAIAGITALLIFGGEVIRNFSFAMLFGILIGTYSSMFIAAPMLGYLGIKRDTVGSAPKSKDVAPVIAPASTAGADRAKAPPRPAPPRPKRPRPRVDDCGRV